MSCAHYIISYSSAVIKFLNDVEIELAQMTVQRSAATPALVDIPGNLPELYRELSASVELSVLNFRETLTVRLERLASPVCI
jgi:hypothetical protein